MRGGGRPRRSASSVMNLSSKTSAMGVSSDPSIQLWCPRPDRRDEAAEAVLRPTAERCSLPLIEVARFGH